LQINSRNENGRQQYNQWNKKIICSDGDGDSVDYGNVAGCFRPRFSPIIVALFNDGNDIMAVDKFNYWKTIFIEDNPN
jgi:hypothetical protein